VIDHYHKNETRLKERSLTDRNEWYGFGRTQGIQDVYKKKYSVCPIIKGLEDLKITLCDKGVGVYGGLYILTNIGEQAIKEVLLTDDFMEYVSLLENIKAAATTLFRQRT
jgi:adenine-specific DNA-methyltransferase